MSWNDQQETYGCVDSVVLCEGEACSEERGKDSSEKHCSFSLVLYRCKR
jgi:hypothetical protein